MESRNYKHKFFPTKDFLKSTFQKKFDNGLHKLMLIVRDRCASRAKYLLFLTKLEITSNQKILETRGGQTNRKNFLEVNHKNNVNVKP